MEERFPDTGASCRSGDDGSLPDILAWKQSNDALEDACDSQ